MYKDELKKLKKTGKFKESTFKQNNKKIDKDKGWKKIEKELAMLKKQKAWIKNPLNRDPKQALIETHKNALRGNFDFHQGVGYENVTPTQGYVG